MTSVTVFWTLNTVNGVWAGQFTNRDALLTFLILEFGHSVKVLQSSHSVDPFGINAGKFMKARLNKNK